MPQTADQTRFACAPRTTVPRALRRDRGDVARHRARATARSPQKYQRRWPRRDQQTISGRRRCQRRHHSHRQHRPGALWRRRGRGRHLRLFAFTNRLGIRSFRRRARRRTRIHQCRVVRPRHLPDPRVTIHVPSTQWRIWRFLDAETLGVSACSAPTAHAPSVRKRCRSPHEWPQAPRIVTPRAQRPSTATATSGPRRLDDHSSLAHGQPPPASTPASSPPPPAPSPRRLAAVRTAVLSHGDTG
jgi:hypothetical protein